MATMRDVAHRAGVSAKTVSRVVNNDRYVSADVRERVERAIDELQYVPNMLAVTFRTGRDAAIGVAVPGVADPFFASIIGAVEREASRRGVAVIVTSVGWEPSHEQRSIEAVLKRQVAGMIICPVGRDMSFLRPWQKRTPLVFVDREPGRLTADCRGAGRRRRRAGGDPAPDLARAPQHRVHGRRRGDRPAAAEGLPAGAGRGGTAAAQRPRARRRGRHRHGDGRAAAACSRRPIRRPRCSPRTRAAPLRWCRRCRRCAARILGWSGSATSRRRPRSSLRSR